MLVETYECEETTSEPIEATEEALRLVEECGLTGQAKMFDKTKEGFDTRCPYRKMTEDEERVYSVLCPNKVAANEYSGSPIPLRVLQVIAHAQSLSFLHEIQVWDKKDADIKDPVLVGVHNKSSYEKERFILARWGEELDEMPALKNRAVAMKRQALKEAAEKIRRLADRYDVDLMDDSDVLKASAPYSIHMD